MDGPTKGHDKAETAVPKSGVGDGVVGVGDEKRGCLLRKEVGEANIVGTPRPANNRIPDNTNNGAGSEEMPAAITRIGSTTQVAQIAWEGVGVPLTGVHRGVRVNKPASPTVRVEGATEDLDVV